MCRRVASAARWKRSTMSAHARGLLGVGTEPPPDSTLPTLQVVINESLLETEPRSVWVICPTFSSSVIRFRRSSTRVRSGTRGLWYGSRALARAAVAR